MYFYYVKPKLTWLKLHQELWLVKVEKEQIRNGFCYSMTHRLSVIQYGDAQRDSAAPYWTDNEIPFSTFTLNAFLQIQRLAKTL